MTDEEVDYWAVISEHIGAELHVEIMEQEGVTSAEDVLDAFTRAFVRLTAEYQAATGVEIQLDLNTGNGLQ